MRVKWGYDVIILCYVCCLKTGCMYSIAADLKCEQDLLCYVLRVNTGCIGGTEGSILTHCIWINILFAWL